MTKVIIPGQNVPISIGGGPVDITWYEKFKILEKAATTDGYGLAGTASGVGVSLTTITASLGADVNLNNTANYFDGPSVAQGTTGTWLASGQVVVNDSSAVSFIAKLWDGVTIISSGVVTISVAGASGLIALSGTITNPAGNIRISVRDPGSVNGKILFNNSGNSKDATLTVVRIA